MTEFLDSFIERNLINTGIGEWITQEATRQENTVELIASENFCSENIRLAMASCLTNKYAEGYPEHLTRFSGNNHRYYGGCQYIDKIEEYCCDRWREVFSTNYHVNVQPHSGSQANFAAYASVLQKGDTILSLSLNNGGHLTHGSPVNFSGKLYNFVFYDVNEDGYIDFNDLYTKIIAHKPKLIVAGASAYSRTIDFEEFKRTIDKAMITIAYQTVDSQNFDVNGEVTNDIITYTKPYFMVDMAHIAGLVATGNHPSPFGIADIITTTTHKTLRGPRGGLIFCIPELAKKVDSAVFPGSQGGPLEHIIAAKAICAEEALTSDYKNYIRKVVDNAYAMANKFKELGYKIVSNGTDNHMFLIDLRTKFPKYTGALVQDILDDYSITVNKNMVPNDARNPNETSGIRIGTPAMTTKGWEISDFISCAERINTILEQRYAFIKK